MYQQQQSTQSVVMACYQSVATKLAAGIVLLGAFDPSATDNHEVSVVKLKGYHRIRVSDGHHVVHLDSTSATLAARVLAILHNCGCTFLRPRAWIQVWDVLNWHAEEV